MTPQEKSLALDTNLLLQNNLNQVTQQNQTLLQVLQQIAQISGAPADTNVSDLPNYISKKLASLVSSKEETK